MPPDPEADLAAESPARLVEAARRRRFELLRAHQDLRDADLTDDQVDEIVRATDEVLEMEDRAARAEEALAYAASSRQVLRAALALGAGSAVLLVVGLIAGWWSAGGVVVLVAGIVAAAVIAVAHRFGPPAGHRMRRTGSLVVLVAGVALACVAPEWAPWWARTVALVVAAVAVAGFVRTVRRPPADEEA
ncbi:hypothetical protein [Pseudonocardia abyssalis]|uniref:DUF1707 domain-containing protein n=1 Tax=Pseudonocardia abyssalis TaxID=2792008 RepID=A0ABS6UQY8_9PSEU|nr:hypothetical protein [Pseudonocardia abyssalis]MBW0116673.1 hypothetical protein [Pseudonocardia abyssalis]MBW0134678.1 hypothetical protein [Pseudonocardia abyssalis]